MSLIESLRREQRYPLQADIRLCDMAHGCAEMTVVDISASGLGLDGLLHFPPDSRVCVEFPDGSRRAGRAMWRDSFWSGIAFDQPMAEDELKALLAILAVHPHFSVSRTG